MPSNTMQVNGHKPIWTWLGIAWRLFIREFGRGELTIIGLAIILAVSSVMALGSVTDRVEQAIMSKSAEFLAADRDLESAHPIDKAYMDKAYEMTLNVDEHIYFSSMAFAGDAMHIATVKAVSETYPLRGKLFVTTDPNSDDIIEKHGPSQGEVWLSKRLFYALELDDARLFRGDWQQVEVGELPLNVTGIIETEPDAPFQVFNSGTRLIMNIKDVAATEVIQPGSRIWYVSLFAGDAEKLSQYDAWVKPQLKENQSYRDVKEGSSGITASLERAESFLMLAGVLGVLLAATAVAVATRLYSQRHLDSIAIFKTLGASKNQVKVVYLFQLVLIATFSVIIGIAIGSVMQALAIQAMADHLPHYMPPIGLKPVIMATLTGFVCALMFSIPSLLRLFSVPSLRVLRRNLGDEIATSFTARFLMGLTTILLVWLYSQNLKFTGIILGAGLVLVILIVIVANLMIRLSRQIGSSVGGSALKIALASLKRRAKENVSQLIGFTLAIMLVLVLYSLENSIIQEWQAQLPEDTPNHFIVNIAQHELDDVVEKIEAQGLKPEQYYPIIRGRLTHINDEKLLQSRKKPEDEDGAKFRDGEEQAARERAEKEHGRTNKPDLDGKDAEEEDKPEPRVGIGRELNMTFTHQFPDNNKLVEGSWMPEDVTDQVSIEKEVAERLAVKLGDQLTFKIGAQEVTVAVTSIREVDWNSFQPNFFMIFSRDVLADFPATYITSFHLPKDKKLWLNQLIKQYPTISIIDVEAMLTQVQTTIKQVSLAIGFVLLVVVIAATLVLLAQVQSSLEERQKETVIYRTLGAKARLIQQAITYEFLSLGAIAGFIAATVAEVSLFLLQWQVFDMDWVPHWELWLIGPVTGAVFVAIVGALSTASLLKMTPNQLIRQLS